MNSNPGGSLDEKAAEAVRQTIKEHMDTKEFKAAVESEYKEQVTDLIRRSERDAKWAAGLVALLIIAVFSALLTLKYADVVSKQADLYEKYSTANELVQKVNKQAADLREDVQSKTKAAQETLAGQDRHLLEFDKRLGDTEDRLKRLQAGAETPSKKSR